MAWTSPSRPTSTSTISLWPPSSNQVCFEHLGGWSHNDLHGGNMLLVALDSFWMIDIAGMSENYGLNDVAKLSASVLCVYCHADGPIDEEACNSLCCLLAAVPTLRMPWPKLEMSLRVYSVSRALWPYVGALGLDSSGESFVWALFRWAMRFTTYPQITDSQRRRCRYLALACAVRV